MGEDVFYLVKEKSVSSFLALKNQQRHSLRAECKLQKLLIQNLYAVIF